MSSIIFNKNILFFFKINVAKTYFLFVFAVNYFENGNNNS